MSLDKTIWENLDGKCLGIYANQFQEGVEYASQIGISQIQLRSVLGREDIDIKVDFKELEKLSKYLRVISFAGVIENIVNFESIYSLNNIEKIYIQQKQKFTIDISKFPKIAHLGGEYWKGLTNINKATTLTSMVLRKLPDINLMRISGLQNLRVLHIYSSKIQSLEGIEKLPIEVLSLALNRSLEDIRIIKNLKALKELDIEKCKKITDDDFLDSLKDKVKIGLLK
jgi:hypothetical protein